METPKSARMRKSEFHYDGKHADDQRLILNDGDREIFELLHPVRGYHMLPGPWIGELTGRAYARNLDNRLARLARAPSNYLIRYKQDRRISKDSVYARHQRADTAMGEKPVYKRDPHAHRLLEDMVQASIEIGVKADPRFRFTHPHELALGDTPDRITVAADDLCPDGAPARIDDESHHLHFIKEIQRSRNNTKNRIRFEHYKALFKSEQYKKKSAWNIDNLVVVFVSKNEADMRELMTLCAEAYDGKCRYIGFTFWHDPWNDSRIEKPTGTMFTCELLRVGFPDTSFSKMWE